MNFKNSKFFRRETPFPFFFFQLGVWLVLFGSFDGGGPLRVAIEKVSKIYRKTERFLTKQSEF